MYLPILFYNCEVSDEVKRGRGRDERISHLNINRIHTRSFDFNEYIIVGLDFWDRESEKLIIFWCAMFRDGEGAHCGWYLGCHFCSYSLHWL